MNKLYRWAVCVLATITAVLAICFQRKIIKNQAEKIKDSAKIIDVKSAVNKINRESEIKAREYVEKVTENDQSMRDYLVNGKLRSDQD